MLRAALFLCLFKRLSVVFCGMLCYIMYDTYKA